MSMKTPREEFAVLLESPTAVEVEMARGLLAEAGIPCMLHGQDRDLAELGEAAHTAISGPDLLVPRAALQRAREALERAWGPGEGEDPASS